MPATTRSALAISLLALLAWSGAARAGAPLPPGVVHPILWNAASNVAPVDEAPGLSTGFTASSAVFGTDIPEDAFGNGDGAVEPNTFIFGDGGTGDNGNAILGDGGETVDFIEWQTTSPTTVLGYELALTQFDPFGRETELVRFLVDGVERDLFDNDSETGADNSTIHTVLRSFGSFVTGSTFRIEVTRSGLAPRITEINALTESFCGNTTVEGAEECDDGNPLDGDGCSAACLLEPGCPAAPAESCVAAAKASLSIKETTAGKEKLTATFQGFESATVQADFGDPATGSTRYDLCVYGPAAELAASLGVDRAGEACGPQAKPCWKDKGGKGWSYKDADASASGVRKLSAASGPAGKGKLQLQAGNSAAKGQNALPMGIATALQGASSATLQVLTSDAPCYEAALSTVQKADGVLFKAKAP
jgi:cysteine-rich repeat protein